MIVRKKFVPICRCPECGYYIHTMAGDIDKDLDRLKVGETEFYPCDCGGFKVTKISKNLFLVETDYGEPEL